MSGYWEDGQMRTSGSQNEPGSRVPDLNALGWSQCGDGTILELIDTLFDCPLYALYIFEVEVYWPGEIEGTLMTPPFTIHGPFDNREDASNLMQSLYEAHAKVDDGR